MWVKSTVAPHTHANMRSLLSAAFGGLIAACQHSSGYNEMNHSQLNQQVFFSLSSFVVRFNWVRPCVCVCVCVNAKEIKRCSNPQSACNANCTFYTLEMLLVCNFCSSAGNDDDGGPFWEFILAQFFSSFGATAHSCVKLHTYYDAFYDRPLMHFSFWMRMIFLLIGCGIRSTWLHLSTQIPHNLTRHCPILNTIWPMT